jgi:phosphatidylinositol glycan class B
MRSTTDPTTVGSPGSGSGPPCADAGITADPTSPPDAPEDRHGRDRVAVALVAAALVVGAIAQLAVVATGPGIIWPDELHQIWEPATRLVRGHGVVAWEFGLGARSWLLPGATAGLLVLTDLAGIDDPQTRSVVLRLAFGALTLVAAVGAVALARRCGAGPRAAAAAAAVVAATGPMVLFAPRLMSEPVSGLALLIGAVLAAHPVPTGRRDRLAGVAFGIAVVVRFTAAPAVAGALAVLAWRRRSAVRPVLVGGGLVAVAGGLLDWLTWGRPFNSWFVYVEANVVANISDNFGTAPWSAYASWWWAAAGPVVVAVGALAVLGARRAPLPAGMVVAGLLPLVAEAHKELRFTLPLVPLVAAVAAVGVEVLAGWGHRCRPGLGPTPGIATVLGVALLATAALGLGRLTGIGPRDIAAYDPSYPHDDPLFDVGGSNGLHRALWWLHDRDDVCGVLMEAPYAMAGYSAFERRVPLYERSGTTPEEGFVNYRIARTTTPPVGEAVATFGRFRVERLAATCTPDPAWRWRIPMWDDDGSAGEGLAASPPLTPARAGPGATR